MNLVTRLPSVILDGAGLVKPTPIIVKDGQQNFGSERMAPNKLEIGLYGEVRNEKILETDLIRRSRRLPD